MEKRQIQTPNEQSQHILKDKIKINFDRVYKYNLHKGNIGIIAINSQHFIIHVNGKAYNGNSM